MMDWDQLVREHAALVFGTAWRILGHAADTEDVVQEVFLQVYEMRGRQPVRHWPALLRRLAACRALDRLRRRKNVVPLNGLSLHSSEREPEAAAIEHEIAQRLREALTQLSDREASVFCLRYFEELSNPQIAETLDISTGAVGVALHKARARLETLLAPVARGDEPCPTAPAHSALSPETN